MNEASFDEIANRFGHRHKMKKTTNILISTLVVLLGIFAIAFILWYDKEGVLTFRWLTVDGTIFNVLCSLIFLGINLVELMGATELTAIPVYYIRLAGAVAEGLIMVVVLLSQLPFFTDHMHILRVDMFCMHILIPVLTITSFVLNDAPIGRLRPLERLQGTWFVSVYAIVIILLIQGGLVTGEMIPYFFLDFAHMSWWLILVAFLCIYGTGYLLSWGISELNRKLSWLWFSGIAKGERK